MKKLIITGMLALLSVPTMFAQVQNSYNMQIELKNGTKVVLGPNDLSSISFNGDALKIEGNTIDQLRTVIESNMKTIASTEEMINQLKAVINMNQAEIAELQLSINKNSKEINDLKAGQGSSDEIEKLSARVTRLEGVTVELQKIVDTQEADQKVLIAKVEADVATLQQALNEQRTSTLNDIKTVSSDILATRDKIEMLQEQIAKLQEQIAKLQESGNTEAVEAKIAVLQNSVNSLEAQSKDLQDALASAVNELQMDVASQKAAMAQVAELAAEQADIKMQVKVMTDLPNALEIMNKNFKSELADQQQSLMKVVRELTTDLWNVRDELNQEIKILKEENEQLKVDNIKLENEINAIKERLQML